MNTTTKSATKTAMVAAAVAQVRAAETASVEDLVQRVASDDDKVRGAAWQGARSYGAPAVKPLAELMNHENGEVARAAKRAIWKIVRYAGRPNATTDTRAVEQDGRPLPLAVRRVSR